MAKNFVMAAWPGSRLAAGRGEPRAEGSADIRAVGGLVGPGGGVDWLPHAAKRAAKTTARRSGPPDRAATDRDAAVTAGVWPMGDSRVAQGLVRSSGSLDFLDQPRVAVGVMEREERGVCPAFRIETRRLARFP